MWIDVGQLNPETKVLHGIGIRVYGSGNILEGHWKNGRMEGEGRYILSSGGYNIGLFKFDRCIKGAFCDSNGKVLTQFG